MFVLIVAWPIVITLRLISNIYRDRLSDKVLVILMLARVILLIFVFRIRIIKEICKLAVLLMIMIAYGSSEHYIFLFERQVMLFLRERAFQVLFIVATNLN